MDEKCEKAEDMFLSKLHMKICKNVSLGAKKCRQE
jgi:hypothetical protein